MPSRPEHLLITGAWRSGTTLVEKLLHAHPEASVASQPFPFIYVEAKRRFDAARGIEGRYSLGHLFGETRYRPSDLIGFLDELRFTEAEVALLLEGMRDYSGWWTPEVAEVALGGGSLLDIRRRMHLALAERFGWLDASAVGSKEILVEEFVPWLLANGERALLVLRDPRAVAASAAGGSGQRYAGRTRPLLFQLRVWRKSVAYALAYRDDPGLLTVRYEDVVASPEEVVARAAEWLGLAAPPEGLLADGLVDQRGEPWMGNSSFGARAGVSGASASRYLDELSGETIRFIETCCWPEILALGYPLHEIVEPDPDEIARFSEPAPVDHPAFAGDDSESPAHAASAERARLEALHRDDIAVDWQRALFLFEQTYAALRDAVTSRSR